MRFIYLDNFRGFQDVSIPLFDVNFCVGENSSGKTSFLSAVILLASHKFWFEQSFDGSETSFKHFSDFVSVSASDQSYFRIGIAEAGREQDHRRPAGSERAVGYLFSYIEKEGMPKLASCTTNVGEKDITFYFEEKAVKYRVHSRKRPLTMEDFGEGVFQEWAAAQNDKSGVGLKPVPDEMDKGFIPPMYLVAMVAREIADKKNRHLVGFPDPPFRGDAAWIAPIRTKPRRTYDEVSLAFSPEGMHVPYLIRKILDGGVEAEKFTSFLRKFGRESGLFKEVNVHKFGESATSPFELEVVLESKPLNMSNVGYGVSQGLPVVVEAFVRPPGSLFAIQQPEVHLHPRAQATIGEMIFTLASTEKKKFIVETHSDFTIDRFRVCLRESSEAVESQIIFFERRDGRNFASPITINQLGDLPEDQPEGYREFFLTEGLRVIGV